MWPRTHILLGLIFSFLIWIVFPTIVWYDILLIFLSSFLIDFDHYMAYVNKTGNWSLFKSLKYHDKVQIIEAQELKKGIKRRGDFHIFHTFEFHLAILAIGLIFAPFLFIFIGMTFHSVMDIISLKKRRLLHRREFFLTNWIKTHCKNC